MEYGEISAQEVSKLKQCVEELSEYHNSVSTYHSGMYPGKPSWQTIEQFQKMVKAGEAKIYACIDKSMVIGFCKIDIRADIYDTQGKLDYLFVRKEYRKQGIGENLMNWAMKSFKQYDVTKIELKVVEGNPAIHFYEKYGFTMNAHIMWRISNV